jgi:hypothetical protein
MLTYLHSLHARLGHIGIQKVLDVVRSGKVTGIRKVHFNKETVSKFKCIACDLAKSKELPIGSTQNPATKLGERLHTDNVPLPIKGQKGEQNFQLTEDEKSRYLF